MKPINCTAEEVLGLLDGSITMLCRVMKPQPDFISNEAKTNFDVIKKCPFGFIGDELWVRERLIKILDYFGEYYPAYAVDHVPCIQNNKIMPWIWKREMRDLHHHQMPELYSRLTLKITSLEAKQIDGVWKWLIGVEVVK